MEQLYQLTGLLSPSSHRVLLPSQFTAHLVNAKSFLSNVV
jgi:hypothetical protein